MKRLFLKIIILCLTTSCFGQNSFPTSNAIWNYKVNAEASISGQHGEKIIYYTICGDIIVNENICNKLYINFDTILCGNNLGEFKGYFRQAEQKVYFTPYYKEYYDYQLGRHFPAEFGQEFLLYDFGLSVGDTIDLNYGFYYRFWRNLNYETYYHDHEFGHQLKRLIVNRVENENGMKKIYLGYGSDYDIWYEGMGSIFGLFHKGEQILDGYSFGFTLNCFKHNDTIKYLYNSDCSKCFCQNYINNKKDTINRNNIQIYFTNYELRITNYELRITNYELQLFDVIGRKILSRKIIDETTTINISHLKNGIYFLEINNETIKIIKK